MNLKSEMSTVGLDQVSTITNQRISITQYLSSDCSTGASEEGENHKVKIYRLCNQHPSYSGQKVVKTTITISVFDDMVAQPELIHDHVESIIFYWR